MVGPIASDGKAGIDMDTPKPIAWSPQLRRAVMRARPEYFSWPAERQERYGMAIPDADRKALNAALMQELFGRSFAVPEQSDARDVLSDDQSNRLNEAILPLTGIGEDAFWLNEHFAEGKSILDFPTLRAFDEDDHRFQEDARSKEDGSGYLPRPYRGSLYCSWARLFIDGKFTYAMLSMAAGYLYSEIQNAAHDLIEARIPHTYVEGPRHGKTEGDLWQWDMRVDAGGQEGVLDELQHRVWDYESRRVEALQSAWDGLGRPGTYILDESHDGETNVHFVFADAQTLSEIHFRTFLRDCRAMARPNEELARAVEEERSALARFIDEQYADVVRNFDPAVVRLRQRRKVMIAKDAFDEL
jgi:hypothetical protein